MKIQYFNEANDQGILGNRTRIATVTAKADLKDTLMWRTGCRNDLKFLGVVDNKESLNVVYNRLIEDAIKDDMYYLVLVHDDLYINTHRTDFYKKVSYYLGDFQVFGLAGSRRISIDGTKPCLWHLMSERKDLHGCVAHFTGPESFAYTSFGTIPARTVVNDGVFLVIDLEEIGNVRFDEKIPSRFHFYDMCFTLDCHLAGLKVGVGDMPIIHASPGLKEFTDEWKKGHYYFVEKYGNNRIIETSNV